MSTDELFSHFATVLPVSDPSVSIEFYKNTLGFEVTFEWNDPIDYAVLRRGGVNIHLTRRQDKVKPSKEHNVIYVFVNDPDAVNQEFLSKGVNIVNPIGDRDYNMRDFDILDPDDHILTFGKGRN